MTFDIWYMKPDFFRDGIMGLDWLREHGPMPDPNHLERTHVPLKSVTVEAGTPNPLEYIYHQMQGEVWSPNGEAWPLIFSKGLKHTSMSMGDIIVADGRTHIVDRFGFSELEAK